MRLRELERWIAWEIARNARFLPVGGPTASPAVSTAIFDQSARLQSFFPVVSPLQDARIGGYLDFVPIDWPFIAEIPKIRFGVSACLAQRKRSLMALVKWTAAFRQSICF
jgi:hypothetical protein